MTQAPKVAGLVPDVALVPHTHPSMKRIGAQVIALRARKERDYLERCLEMGRLLRQARTRLAHGSWRPWLRDVAKLGKSSAHNYVSLSTWAEEKPQELRRWRSLGASKLFVVAKASDRARADLRKLSTRKLADMSVPELRLVVARSSMGRTEPSVSRRIARLRRRMHGVVREVHQLLELGALPDDEIDTLRDLLKEASEALHG
jgi:hypothetical protein